MSIRPRELRLWQREALEKYEAGKPEDYLVTATPGAGKTTFALTLAGRLREARLIDRIIVVVPTDHLRTQWADAASGSGLLLDPTLKNSVGPVRPGTDGYITTYAQVASHPMLHRARTQAKRTLVILDEIHHAGDSLSWGDAVVEAFSVAARRLCLTGTPFRTNPNERIPFVRYEDSGDGDLLSDADYTYGYADALRDGGVVRPVYFPRFDGVMEWSAPDGSVVSADFHDELARDGMSQRLRTALSLDGDWLAAVLRQAHERLMLLRTMPNGQPDAGGLVIAMDQAHAHGIAALIRRHFGVPAEVVVSDDPTASDRIARFATSDAPWLVAVRMVSEGVDIPRLRVGVYATTVTTELFFRQAVGRFVRWQADRGSQKAYVFLPDDPRLRTHAFQIAEARRHVLRPPVPNDDDPEGPDRADDLTGGVEAFEPEQLSLFSVLSSVATGMRISAVTPEGVAYDDEPEQLAAAADADPELDGLLDLLLPDIPTDAGWSRDLGRSVAEVKQDLRARNAAVAQRLVDLTGLSHGKVNAEMNRLASVAAVGAATTDQLERRLRQAEAWLGRIRGRGPSDRPR